MEGAVVAGNRPGQRCFNLGRSPGRELLVPAPKAGNTMNLERAVEIAVEAHRGRSYKAGIDQILQPKVFKDEY